MDHNGGRSQCDDNSVAGGVLTDEMVKGANVHLSRDGVRSATFSEAENGGNVEDSACPKL